MKPDRGRAYLAKAGNVTSSVLALVAPGLSAPVGIVRLLIATRRLSLDALDSQRLRRFVKLLNSNPEMDFDELRLRLRSAPGKETVRRELRSIMDDFENAHSDEVLGPMVTLIAEYSRTKNRADSEQLLAIARLLSALRAQDLPQLRILIREALQHSSNEDPVVLWHGAASAQESAPATLVKKGEEGVALTYCRPATRIFRLLKSADLGIGTEAIEIGDVNVDFIPGAENAIVVPREGLRHLERILG